MVFLDIKHQNVCLLNLNVIIRYCSITTINNLNSYGIECNIKNTLCKKFIISDLIHEMCESLNNLKTTNKVVFYFNKEDKDFNWYNEFFNSEELSTFFVKLCKTIEKNIPLRIFTGKVSVEYIDSEISNPEIVLLINEISLYVQKHNLRPVTFAKARKFLDKYKLTFLSNKYFTTIKSKQLMYK